MSSSLRRGLAVLLVAAGTFAGRTANAQTVAPPPVVNPALYAFGYSPYPRAVAGYLNGVANVTTANAQYQLTIQQARIAREQARQASIDTRRMMLEEQERERAMQPTPEEVRQAQRQQQLDRARDNPPLTEIWSGRSLNTLLTALEEGQKRGLQAPPIALDQDALKHINLTTGVTSAGAGVLKDLTRFTWPLILKSPPFQDDRQRVEALARQAMDQLANGGVSDGTALGLDDSVKAMQAELDSEVRSISPTDYIQGARYLRELTESFKTFQDPNAANYFNGKWQAKGSTVADLINQMSSQGLQFAPAAPGDEPSYTVLYRSLSTYDYWMGRMAATR